MKYFVFMLELVKEEFYLNIQTLLEQQNACIILQCCSYCRTKCVSTVIAPYTDALSQNFFVTLDVMLNYL